GDPFGLLDHLLGDCPFFGRLRNDGPLKDNATNAESGNRLHELTAGRAERRGVVARHVRAPREMRDCRSYTAGAPILVVGSLHQTPPLSSDSRSVMPSQSLDPIAMLRPRRKIVGMSAVLLPYDERGHIDWESFRAQLSRTFAVGLIPAVNMDTGYVNLLTADERREVLTETRKLANGKEYVAGAFVSDSPGAEFDLDGYRRAIDTIREFAGTPVVFQSYGLTALAVERMLDAYRSIARHCSRFVAFELGTMFAPFGRIYDLDTYAGLL